MQVSFLQHFLVLLPDSLTGFQPCSFCHVNDEITFITAKEILNFWRKKEKEQGLWKHLPRHHPHTNQTPTNHPPTHSSTFPPPTYQSPTTHLSTTTHNPHTFPPTHQSPTYPLIHPSAQLWQVVSHANSEFIFWNIVMAKDVMYCHGEQFVHVTLWSKC